MSRTDIALESAERLMNEGAGEIEGISRHERESGGCRITEIAVRTAEAAKKIGRERGRYVTIDTADLGSIGDIIPAARVFSSELRGIIGEAASVLVIGLGNKSITPDGVGPAAAEKILATRHLKRELSEEELSGGLLHSLAEVTAIAPGVLGQTGIEAAELVSAVCERVRPSAVIAVDALACSSAERLGRTVQLCDTGISPGSGVQNSRRELSERTLGVRTIAVGVPTVMDMQGDTPMMITPRTIDRLAANAGELIALGINMALQPQLGEEEIISLTM